MATIAVLVANAASVVEMSALASAEPRSESCASTAAHILAYIGNISMEAPPDANGRRERSSAEMPASAVEIKNRDVPAWAPPIRASVGARAGGNSNCPKEAPRTAFIIVSTNTGTDIAKRSRPHRSRAFVVALRAWPSAPLASSNSSSAWWFSRKEEDADVTVDDREIAAVGGGAAAKARRASKRGSRPGDAMRGDEGVRADSRGERSEGADDMPRHEGKKTQDVQHSKSEVLEIWLEFWIMLRMVPGYTRTVCKMEKKYRRRRLTPLPGEM